VHTDGLVWTYNGMTSNPGGMTTTNLAVTSSAAYTGLLLTAQAASIDPTQGGLGLAISNGATLEVPPLPSPAPVMKAYSNGSTTATTGATLMTPALVTRFEY
jgi:hypothetical protein